MKKLTDKIRKAWPIRKGCFHCGAPLTSSREKILRTCKTCASTAREGFEKMGQGQFKEGYGQVADTMYGKNIEKRKALDETMKRGLTRKEKKIRDKLKRKGLSDEEVEQGMKEFKNNIT